MPFRKDLSHRLRAERPQAPDELVGRVKSEMSAAEPKRRSSRVQPRFRLAGMSAAFALGLLVIGGAGFAMNYSGGFITGITHGTIIHTRTYEHAVVLNAANDQYGTTTTQTTTTTSTTTVATTTTSDGTKSTQVKSGNSGSVTVAPPTGGRATQVNWSAGTFGGTVNVTVDPTPPIAAPAFAGPASDQIVSITVTDPTTGQAIHTLSSPLEIVFPNAPKGYVPAMSEDGVNFQALPLLTGTTLPAGQPDGYYVDANGAIHILTIHLTQFAVLYKANYTVSETGRKLAPAGSGKFGDPTRMHIGAPNVDIAGATASGSNVALSYFVDEQVAVYVHVLSNGKELVMGNHSTIRKHTIGGKSRTTFHVVILRPGTINMNLKVPGLKPGAKVQLTFVDYDGHTVTKTVTVS
jgi:hypothetical protein